MSKIVLFSHSTKVMVLVIMMVILIDVSVVSSLAASQNDNKNNVQNNKMIAQTTAATLLPTALQEQQQQQQQRYNATDVMITSFQSAENLWTRFIYSIKCFDNFIVYGYLFSFYFFINCNKISRIFTVCFVDF
jgi:ABC-type transport system involved in cytochrome bd biosynthesis fused ATPase/permease subunit